MEVETLAAEIQTGVQHRNGPPLDSSQTTSWSLSLGRPFFMAFLTMRSESVAVGCHGLPIGLFEPFSGVSHLPRVATGCARLALSEEGPRVKFSRVRWRLLWCSRAVGCSSLSWRCWGAHRVGGSCPGFSFP